jgi:hypothetical protein
MTSATVTRSPGPAPGKAGAVVGGEVVGLGTGVVVAVLVRPDAVFQVAAGELLLAALV